MNGSAMLEVLLSLVVGKLGALQSHISETEKEKEIDGGSQDYNNTVRQLTQYHPPMQLQASRNAIRDSNKDSRLTRHLSTV